MSTTCSRYGVSTARATPGSKTIHRAPTAVGVRGSLNRAYHTSAAGTTHMAPIIEIGVKTAGGSFPPSEVSTTHTVKIAVVAYTYRPITAAGRPSRTANGPVPMP